MFALVLALLNAVITGLATFVHAFRVKAVNLTIPLAAQALFRAFLLALVTTY